MASDRIAGLAADRLMRNLDWNLLRTFHAIVQAGNLTRAAASLGRKQPAVSLALRRLEGHLGVSLCVRAWNRFELTPEGMLVARSCEEIFGQIRELPNRIANVPGEIVGQLRIVTVSSVTSERLDHALAAYHRQYPQVEIQIDVVPWEEVGRRLRRLVADIGIAPARFLDAGFRYSALYSEPIGLYCGREHPLFGRKFRRPEELADVAVVLTGGDEPDVIRKYRLEHGLGRLVAGQSEFLDEAKRLTLQGVGICFLPEPFVRAEVSQKFLWPLLPKSKLFASDIYVVSLPPEQVSLPTKMFLGFFGDH